MHMAQLYTENAEDFEYDDQVISAEDARTYAAQVATEAIEAYASRTGTTAKNTQGNPPMNNEINSAAEAIKQETLLSAKLVSGEILLDNIETIADRLVMSHLSWFQKLSISKKQKEMAITLSTYAIVHAIKTGGFGLTNYRINHVALDYVTLAANQRMVKYLVSSVGIDTNVAGMFLTAPELTTVKG